MDHGGAWTNDGNTLPPLLDLENSPYTVDLCYGLSPVAIVSWVRDYEATLTTLVGRAPVIYTTQEWWHECTGDSTAFSASPLFLSRWAADPGPLPAGWDAFTLWQYAKSAP